MNLAQTYSLSAGQKIKKPFISPQYYPLSFDKYIVFSPNSKESKTYNYWAEVLSLIVSELNKIGIKIIQTGAKDEQPYKYCHHTQGTTSVRQVSYLVKNSILCLSADSFVAHLAGMYDKKLVSIYSNNYLSCVKPFWGSAENQILLEPDRKGNKPCFAFQEFPKTINQISPESIASAVLKLLNLEFNYSYNTLYLGQNYPAIFVESLLDGVYNIPDIETLIIRGDLLFNEQILAEQLKVKKAIIITSKPINEQILQYFRGNIKEVIYKLHKGAKPDFLKTLQSSKIPFRMVSDLEGEDLNNLKVMTMDFGVIFNTNKNQPDNLKDKNLSNIYYKSNKFLLGSGGKIFSSKMDYINGRNINNFESQLLPIGNAKNLEDLFEEKENHIYLEKLS